MPTKYFNIAGATLQDLFSFRDQHPDIWITMQPELSEVNTCPVAILLPGVYPCLVPEDLEQETFGQSIDAGAAIQLMQEDELSGRLQLLAIYFQPAFDGGEYDSDRVPDAELLLRWLPAEVAMGVSNHFLNELTRINSAMGQSLRNIPYTKEEIKAGIRELEKYGPFATIHNLSKSNGKSIKWWAKQPWAYVNNYLRMENEKAFIQHELHKRLNPQAA